MKCLAVFILSISLLATSPFAVSLNAPLVLKMQEDRSMAADFAAEDAAEQDFNPLKPIVGVYSVGLMIIGAVIIGLGFEWLYDEDNRNAGAMIGGGAGVMFLGGIGVYWAF